MFWLDAEILQGGFEAVFKPLLRSSLVSLAFGQLSVEEHFREPVALHTAHMSRPPELGFLQQGVNASHFSFAENFSVRNFVLPADLENLPQAIEVEAVEFFGMPLVHCPGLTGVQKNREDGCIVDLQFGFQLQPSSVPDRCFESAEGLAGFGDAQVYFIVDGNCSVDGASEVDEFVSVLEH